MRQLHIILLLIFSSSTLAQVSQNMTLNTNWNDTSLPTSSGVRFNDIWGHVDCQGNEYAIVGSARFAHFFDVTNPNNITEVSRIEGTVNSIWRDFKTYQNYAYGVADQGNEGLSIFNMSNLPNSAFLVNRDDSDFTKAHNIFVDEKNGRLYVAGSNGQNNGLIVYDLTQNPAVPQKIASVALPGGGYVHDIYVRDNIAYCSHGFNGYYIWNMINPANPIALAATQTNGYNHSSWVTDDGHYAIVAEEVPAGLPLLVVDLTNLASGDIEVVKDFKEPLLAPDAVNNTPHNPFIRGKHLISSYYEDGVQVFDISDPLNPERIAYYDTAPQNTSYSGTNNNWGVYPYLPSGTIIATDTDNGFFVLTPTYDDVAPVGFDAEPNVNWVSGSDINVCDGATVVLETTGTAENYTWYKDGAIINGEIGSSLTIQSGGRFRVEVDNNLCSKTLSSIDVNFQALPSVEFTPLGISTIKLCEGNSSMISVPLGAQTYSWTKDGIFFSESNSVNVNESGNYQVTASINGCPNVSSIVNVEVSPYPNVDWSIADSIAICFGDTTILEIEAGAELYEWFLFGIPLNGENDAFLKASSSGDYKVEATSNGCTSVSSMIKINAKPVPLSEINSNNSSICEGESTVVFTNQGADSYNWTLNNEPFEVDNLEITTDQAGLYQVTTELDGCTSTSPMLEINVNTPPNVALNTSENGFICEGEQYNLVIPETAEVYQWYKNGVAIENAINNAFDVSESGTYYVEASNGNCLETSSSIDVSVTAFESVTILNTTENEIELCEGETFELITDERVGTYQWMKDGVNIDNANQNVFTVVESGTYQVMYTQNNCSDISTEIQITINNYPSLDLNVGSQVELCQGESIDLAMAEENGIFQWYKDGEAIENATNSTYNVDESGNYALLASNGNCSVISGTIEVTITARPIANIVEPQQSTVDICAGEIVEFLAVPQNGTYQWLQNGNAITNTNENKLLAASAGLYQMMITNNGCTTLSREIQINTISFPEIELNIDPSVTICAGESVMAEIPMGADSYGWFYNDEAVDNTNSNLFLLESTGNYYVTAANNNCSISSEIISVNVNELPDASFTNTNASSIDICEGEISTLSVIEGADSYTWSKDGAILLDINTSTIEISETGIYQVVITQNNCASTSSEIELNVKSLPNVALNMESDIMLCEGETMSIEIPVGADRYQWFLDDVAVENATTNNLSVETTGNYYVTATTNDCALNSEIVSVTVNTFPDAALLNLNSNDITVCEGETSVLSVLEGADLYEWSKDNVLIPDFNTSTIEVSEAGIYQVAVTQNNCTSISSEVSLTLNSAPNVELNTTNEINLCINPTFTASVPNGANSYQWFLNEMPIDEANNSSYEIHEPGSYTVMAQTNECSANSLILEAVTQATIDTIDTGTIVTCDDTPFSINTTAMLGSFEWVKDGVVVDTVSTIFNVEESGDYQLITYENDCPVSVQIFSIEFASLPAILATVVGETTFCDGEFVVLQTLVEDPSLSYVWYRNGEIIAEMGSIFANATGSYALEVTNNETGCSSISEPFEITVNELPIAIISVDGEELTAVTAESYQWYFEGEIIPGATEQIYLAEETGNYSVQITDENNCSSIPASVFIMITNVDYIESLDSYKVFPNPASEIITLRFNINKNTAFGLDIFNNLGQLVFSSQTHSLVGQNDEHIDVSEWDSGIYLLRIQDQDQFLYEKIIVE